MYVITHNIDNEKSTLLYNDTQLIAFTHKIAIENEDDPNLITSIGMAKHYLNDCCSNLTLTTPNGNPTVLNVSQCFNCPFCVRQDEETLGDGQYICTEIERQQIPWEEKDGFDDFIRTPLLGTPKACPLKKSAITIILQNSTNE